MKVSELQKCADNQSDIIVRADQLVELIIKARLIATGNYSSDQPARLEILASDIIQYSTKLHY